MNIIWQPLFETFIFHCRKMICENVIDPIEITITTRPPAVSTITIFSDTVEPDINNLVEFPMLDILSDWLLSVNCLNGSKDEVILESTNLLRVYIDNEFQFQFWLYTGVVGTGRNYSVEKTPSLYDFVENCSDIEIFSVIPQIITFKKNDEIFVEEQYFPFKNIIKISTKNLLRDYFFSKIPSSNPFLQNDNSAEIGVYIGNINVVDFSFVAINGGVKIFENTNNIFFRKNLLTIQPQITSISKNATYFVNFFALKNYETKLLIRIYSNDLLHNDTEIIVDSLDSYYSYQYNYSLLKSYVTYDFVKVEFLIYSKIGSNWLYSFSQRVLFDAVADINNDFFIFENSMGGLETVCLNGIKETAEEHKSTSYRIDDITMEYKNLLETIFKKNTGFFKSKDLELVAVEFFKSKKRYHLVGAEIMPINIDKIDSKSIPYTINDFNFEYYYSEQVNLAVIPARANW